MKILFTKKFLIIFTALVLATFAGKTVLAVWSGTFYEPGDTLNPECLPTDVDCDVRAPLTTASISDAVYGAGWDTDTTHAPSKNAVYDEIQTLVASNHNPVTLGVSANGLSLATQVLSLALASTSTTGALSDTDWDTFNNKQDALVSGTSIKTINGSSILAAGDLTLLTSLSGAVLTDQSTPQTIGLTGARLAKLWAIDIESTSMTVGGGYGSTGVTISDAGAISTDGSVLIGDPTAVGTFTGSHTEGLRIKGEATTLGNYSLLGFYGYDAGTYPRNYAQIGARASASGSYLVFGTSNDFASGITNTALQIDYNGNSLFGGGYGSTGVTISDAGALSLDGGLIRGTPVTADATADSIFAASSATQTPLVVQGAAAQSANLQEWQTSAGVVAIAIQSGGLFQASNISETAQGGITFGSGSSANGSFSGNRIGDSSYLWMSNGRWWNSTTYSAVGTVGGIAASGIFQSDDSIYFYTFPASSNTATERAKISSSGLTVGGGYGSTGVTIGDTGTISTDGAVGIRGASGTSSAGLYVPWVSGDTASTAYFGSTNSGMDQAAIEAHSYSGNAAMLYSDNDNNLPPLYLISQGTPATFQDYVLFTRTEHNAGAGAVGLAGKILHQIESTTNGQYGNVQEKFSLIDATAGSVESAWEFSVGSNGTLTPAVYLVGQAAGATAWVGINQAAATAALDVLGDTKTSGNLYVGGGYGSTGVTISDAGAISADGLLTVSVPGVGDQEVARFSDPTGDPFITIGNGLTSTTGGFISWTDATDRLRLGVNGVTELLSLSQTQTTINGGYGSTGVTISDAGAISADGLYTGTLGAIFNESGADSDFRVEGDTEPNAIFMDATYGTLGLATTSINSRLNISNTSGGGVWVDATTISNSAGSAQASGYYANVTGSGTGAYGAYGLFANVNAGYTGTGSTGAFGGLNASASPAATFSSTTYGFRIDGNHGGFALVNGTTTGNNVGALGTAANGNRNFGLWGASTIAKDSALNIGVIGFGQNTGTSGVQIGGYFGLEDAVFPTMESAALIADNSDQASPIFLARDNGTTVFSIADGGATSISSSLTVGGGYGSTGATISDAGAISADGLLTASGVTLGTGVNLVNSTVANVAILDIKPTDGTVAQALRVIPGSSAGYTAFGETQASLFEFHRNSSGTDRMFILAPTNAASGYKFVSYAPGGSPGPFSFGFNSTGAGDASTTVLAISSSSVTIGGGYGSTGATISDAGVGQFNGALTTDGLLTAKIEDAITNTTTTVLSLGHNSTSTPLASFGSDIMFNLESSTTADRNAARIKTFWGTATDAGRTGKMQLSVYSHDGEAPFLVGTSQAGPSAAVSIGNSAAATGIGSIALGSSSLASGEGVLALGARSTASGISSTAIGGAYSTASGIRSVSMGQWVTASNTNSIIIGNGWTDNGAQINNVAWTLMFGGYSGNTNSILDQFKFVNNSTGTAATGFGSSLKLSLESSTTVDQDAAAIKYWWTDATHASRSAALGLFVSDFNGEYEFLRGTPTELVINEDSYDMNLRVEGGTDTSLLFVDAGTNRVGIGNSAPGTMLTVGTVTTNTGNITVYGTGTTCTIGDGTGATNCTSDIRLKDNIATLESELENIMALRPVTFNWKDKNKDQITNIGLIAQEVQSIYPTIVHTVYDDYLGIDYAALIVPTIKAVQELNLNLEGITGTIIPLEGSSEESFVTAFFNNLFTKITAWLADATNGIGKIFTGEVETKLLCVSDEAGEKTCITKDQLDVLLTGADMSPEPEPEPEPAPEVIPETTPEPEVIPGPTPEVTPEPEVISESEPSSSAEATEGQESTSEPVTEPTSEPEPVIP